jgi:hypothetical protein
MRTLVLCAALLSTGTVAHAQRRGGSDLGMAYRLHLRNGVAKPWGAPKARWFVVPGAAALVLTPYTMLGVSLMAYPVAKGFLRKLGWKGGDVNRPRFGMGIFRLLARSTAVLEVGAMAAGNGFLNTIARIRGRPTKTVIERFQLEWEPQPYPSLRAAYDQR